MEYLLCFGLVVGLPTWFVLRSIGAANQQKALEEYAWSLQNWEHRDDGYQLRINFPAMRAFERRFSHEYGGFDDRNEYEVRRGERDGCWQTRLTPDSHVAELARVRAAVKGPMGPSLFQEQLDDLESGRKWSDLAETWQPAIETAYQRYVHRS